MRDIPKTLRIGPMTYPVLMCEDADFESDAVCGECCYITRRIKLLRVLHPQSKRNVLWHEVGEAIKALDTLEIEHETLTVAFNRALEVLDANPALRRYLWGGK